MRIGTWNLEGRWSEDHQRLLAEQACDVWLLTEVNDRVQVDGMRGHRTEAEMAPGRRWAAIFSASDLEHMEDPHPASAMARVGSTVFVSSILPWRACGNGSSWVGDGHAEKTRNAVEPLSRLTHSSIIWGGDWNHALDGREWAGSKGGREHVLETVRMLGLVVPTATLAHAIPGLRTIDHIAVPGVAAVHAAHRVAVEREGSRLSDHDAYVVTLDIPDNVTVG